jgi:hypothetical protein
VLKRNLAEEMTITDTPPTFAGPKIKAGSYSSKPVRGTFTDSHIDLSEVVGALLENIRRTKG